jgi:hypothetical protein
MAMTLSLCGLAASAKTNPAGQTVGTVLFYVHNSKGENILASHVTVAQMEKDLEAGLIDSTNHNYSLLDRYITTLHQEAEGFTVPDFVTYAQKKSALSSIRNLNLTFAGQDEVRFWEIDQTGFDDLDSYTYQDLYGTPRYNFPLLYEYWNYKTQDYYDPAGKMTRDQVIDYIFSHGEPETTLLSVRAFSQRYMVTDSKYGTGDYNMENCWKSSGLLDNARTLRVMKPMTKEELYNKTPTASDTRYWVANILLDMDQEPELASLGKVAAPTATMTEDADNYYITFSCATSGATILYNHNYISPSYTPTCAYTGGTVSVPKSAFPDGGVTMTCRAVKDGYTDAGVQTLTLKASGTQQSWKNPYTDVAADSWCKPYVQYVTEKGLFDATGTGTTFSPNAPMTRAMLATALYRMAGKPKAAGITSTPFTDVSPSANDADAVAWAYGAGVVNGKTHTTFAPNARISRQQITAMFYRYAEKVAKADMSVSKDLSAFTDAGNVSDYAKDAMRWGVGAGMINGTSATTLSPYGTATRAQVAAMVTRLARYLG